MTARTLLGLLAAWIAAGPCLAQNANYVNVREFRNWVAVFVKYRADLERCTGRAHPEMQRDLFGHIDELYENVIVNIVALKGLFAGFEIFDRRGVDGIVNGVSSIVLGSGRTIRRAQTGQLQLYGLFIGIGVAVIAICMYLFA